jgi:ubiquinol-cytochrome c reductase cytochrome b subunit
VILLLVPFINTSEIRSPEFRPIYSVVFWVLVADFCILGWIGQKPVEDPYVLVGALATGFYFLFFLVLMPLIGIVEKQLVRAKVN